MRYWSNVSSSCSDVNWLIILVFLPPRPPCPPSPPSDSFIMPDDDDDDDANGDGDGDGDGDDVAEGKRDSAFTPHS
jgi:hypothetical protein